MVATGKPGDANSHAGDFGEAWLGAVAAGSGLLHGPSTTLDLEKADVELVLEEEIHDTYNPRVKVQVKTAHGLRTDPDGSLVYDLDVDTYDVLRRTNHSARRILAVIELSDSGERVRLDADGTLLVGRGAWVSLEGQPATSNTASTAVRLPPENTLDPDGLRRMLTTFGIRSTSRVPDIDPWGDA